MEDKFLQQMKKGVLEMLVLELISKVPMYGYELLLVIKEKSEGLFSLKEGTLYPILYRLEDDELIVSKWEKGEGRKTPKKVYSITQIGIEEIENRKNLWKLFRDKVDLFIEEEKTNEKETTY